MNILFVCRPDLNQSKAGDTVQILNTKIQLQKMKHSVYIYDTNIDIRLEDFDIVHYFNLNKIDNTAMFFLGNKSRYKYKVVISPMFVDMSEYYNKTNKIKLASWRTNNILKRKIIESSDLILPNSQAEEDSTKKILMTSVNSKVINNGINPNEYNDINSSFIDKYEIQDYILCVARICPLKNQLSLIKACKNINKPLVLVGPVNDSMYAKELIKEAKGMDIYYIPWLEKEILLSAYKHSLVTVLPSWYETAGLSCLEAAAAGSCIVVTNRGGPKNYFDSHAFYCSPDNINSIHDSITKALTSNIKNSSRDYIFNKYTWRKTAQQTLDAYKGLINQKVTYDKRKNSTNYIYKQRLK